MFDSQSQRILGPDHVFFVDDTHASLPSLHVLRVHMPSYVFVVTYGQSVAELDGQGPRGMSFGCRRCAALIAIVHKRAFPFLYLSDSR